MKTINTYSTYNLLALLLLIGLIIVSTGCKDDDNDDNPHPPLSYFSCKVNGEKFERRGLFGRCNGTEAFYYPEGIHGVEAGTFIYRAIHCPEPHERIGFRVHDLFDSRLYHFDQSDSLWVAGYRFYNYEIDPNIEIVTNQVLSGFIDINEISPRERKPDGSKKTELGWVEGTFEFTLKDEDLDTTIHVTEGRFGHRLQ